MENSTNQMLPLELTKQAILKKINEARLQELAKGVEFNGTMYDASHSSISTLSALISAMKIQLGELPTIINWKAIDNSISAYNIDELISLLTAMVKFTQYVYEKSWVKKEEIADITTFSELTALGHQSLGNAK